MDACVMDNLVLHVDQIYGVFLRYEPLMTSCGIFQRASELPGGLFFTNISHLLIWPQLNPASPWRPRNQSGWLGHSLVLNSSDLRITHVISESASCILQHMSPGIYLECMHPLVRGPFAVRVTRELFFTTCEIIDHAERRHVSASVAFQLYAANGERITASLTGCY